LLVIRAWADPAHSPLFFFFPPLHPGRKKIYRQRLRSFPLSRYLRVKDMEESRLPFPPSFFPFFFFFPLHCALKSGRQILCDTQKMVAHGTTGTGAESNSVVCTSSFSFPLFFPPRRPAALEALENIISRGALSIGNEQKFAISLLEFSLFFFFPFFFFPPPNKRKRLRCSSRVKFLIVRRPLFFFPFSLFFFLPFPLLLNAIAGTAKEEH